MRQCLEWALILPGCRIITIRSRGRNTIPSRPYSFRGITRTPRDGGFPSTPYKKHTVVVLIVQDPPQIQLTTSHPSIRRRQGVRPNLDCLPIWRQSAHIGMMPSAAEWTVPFEGILERNKLVSYDGQLGNAIPVPPS